MWKLNEAIDVVQNHPLWRLMSMFGVTHCRWCMQQKKKNLMCPIWWSQ